MSSEPPVSSESSSQSGDTFQMLWDCEYCGTKKLLGLDHRFCPNCGAAQNPQKRYFPESAEDKIAVEDHIYHGADKVCASCSTPSSAIVEFCPSCGGPMSEGAAAKHREEQRISASGVIESAAGAEGGAAGEQSGWGRLSDDYKSSVAAAPPQKKSRKGLFIGLGIVGAVAALAASLFLWKSSEVWQVSAHEWQKDIKVEKYGPQREASWCDQMPLGATNVTRTREVRSHNRVPDGQECTTVRVDQGDGTFRESQDCRTKYREEPVYDMKCSYMVMRWVFDRNITSRGDSRSDNRPWPEARLRSGQCVGCERESGREETLTLHLRSPEAKDDHCSVSEPIWLAHAVGDSVVVEVRRLTGGVDCSSIAMP